ncbi:glycosyltransferase [Pseudoalteromonas piratica]|uniref:Glycosyltransferase n=1 Tax=Pseudoalteromonas piratica TaxID=1348114 RepID=A0A0A7EJ57_9GAMM|nr:glycosyltransferase [Pseudoalteromonas piratica]AIY66654.1 glycosyltransferase [Pseudoalteromonas piratica]
MRFVVFAEDWGRHPSSTQHIFKVIAEQYDVTWFNSVGMRKPKFNLTDIKRVFGKLKLMLSKPSPVSMDKIPVDARNPFVLPWHDRQWVRAFNKQQIAKQIDLTSAEPIVYWISVPTAINMIQLRPQDSLIYYCGDDFSNLAGVDADLIQESERRLIHQAHNIFVVSKVLLDKMPKHKTQMLEHGVDYTLFSELKKRNKQLNQLDNIIGFYGSLSEWLDVELLIKLAKARPQYNLVLIGKADIDISALVALPNVTYIAQMAHHQLASFSQHWQVSLLPFLDNGQIRACNPLKLKEYLAAGKPIVSSYFPAVERYKDTVLIARDEVGFIARVDQAMVISKNPFLDWRTYSRQLVEKHSWQQKAAFVMEQLN